MHLGLCKKYAYRPRDLTSCFVRALVHWENKPSRTGHNPFNIFLKQENDVICINEYHCLDNVSNQSFLPVYSWFWHSRKWLHKTLIENVAESAFLSLMCVCWLMICVVWTSLIEVYRAFCYPTKLLSSYCHILVYLLPENSPWRCSDVGFVRNYIDRVLICGDVNGKIGICKNIYMTQMMFMRLRI